MKWPWVSRYYLDFVERQLAASEAERSRLLEILLGQTRPATAERAEIAEPRKVEPQTQTSNPEPGNVVAFTTPFDTIEKRAAVAIRNKQMPEQFKARMR